MPVQQIQISLPEWQAERLTRQARQEGTSITQVIERLIGKATTALGDKSGEAGATAEPRKRGGLGMDAGKGWIADDFDAPLPEDLQLFFEGRS